MAGDPRLPFQVKSLSIRASARGTPRAPVGELHQVSEDTRGAFSPRSSDVGRKSPTRLATRPPPLGTRVSALVNAPCNASRARTTSIADSASVRASKSGIAISPRYFSIRTSDGEAPPTPAGAASHDHVGRACRQGVMAPGRGHARKPKRRGMRTTSRTLGGVRRSHSLCTRSRTLSFNFLNAPLSRKS